MSADNKKAFLVANNLVKVGSRLFPVTHRFIVMEEEWEFNILECYNCAVALRPGNVRGMNQEGGHTFSITFANTRLSGGGIMLTPPYSISEIECVRDYRGDLFESFIRHLELNTGSWIGNTGLPNSYTGFNQKMTLSYNGIPDLYSPSEWVEGERWTKATYHWYEQWFYDQNPGIPQHDYVFWLYENTGKGTDYYFSSDDWNNTLIPVEVNIPPFSNFRDDTHVTPQQAAPSNWNTVQRSDATFLPG